jgi:hypothetical protein
MKEPLPKVIFTIFNCKLIPMATELKEYEADIDVPIESIQNIDKNVLHSWNSSSPQPAQSLGTNTPWAWNRAPK